MLVITLGYYHDYRTMENISRTQATNLRSGGRVEQTLIKEETFALPSKRTLVSENADISVIIADAA